VKGAVGYVELIYALGNKLPYASIKTSSTTSWPSLRPTNAAAGLNLPKTPPGLDY
jgi:hypothetical protein